MVKLLIGRRDIDINKQDANGSTAIMEAVKAEQISILNLLLERNEVNINIADNTDRTPLCRAVLQGSQRMVRLLLPKADSRLNKKGQYDYYGTPLVYAVKGKDSTILNLLKERMTKLGLEVPDNTSQD